MSVQLSCSFPLTRPRKASSEPPAPREDPSCTPRGGLSTSPAVGEHSGALAPCGDMGHGSPSIGWRGPGVPDPLGREMGQPHSSPPWPRHPVRHPSHSSGQTDAPK